MDVYKADIISIPEGSVKRILDMNNVVLWKSNRYTPFYVEDVTGGDNKVIVKKRNSHVTAISVEKSSDGKTWEPMGETTAEGVTASIPRNGRLYLRCKTTTWANNSYYSNGIDVTGDCIIGGNIMSLLYGNEFTGDETIFPSQAQYTFCSLFSYNTYIISASKLVLPATTLNPYCYLKMFNGCTSLTKTPTLPATALAQGCYMGMFSDCASLTKTPTLPATALVWECYSGMFMGCTSLTTTPELPATTLDYACYDRMFYGCSLLNKAPRILPATTLADHCYSNMFSYCTSLTTAPELPATTLVSDCYYSMFYNCSSLNKIVAYANLVSSNWYTGYWVGKVSATGTFYKKAGSTWPSGQDGIPSGWTVIEV